MVNLLQKLLSEQLRELGQPKSTKEIYNAVVAVGFVVPVRKARKRDKPIFDALLMRERKVGGVFRTRDRKRNLDEWCSPEEVTRLKEEHVRADDEHLERTRRGIEKARQQGKQIGARPLIDGETRERVMQMFRANMTKAAIARAIGVSVATINNNFPGVVRRSSRRRMTGPARRSRQGKQRPPTPSPTIGLPPDRRTYRGARRLAGRGAGAGARAISRPTRRWSRR